MADRKREILNKAKVQGWLSGFDFSVLMMERHPEWFERKSTSSGFVIYWGVKLEEVV